MENGDSATNEPTADQLVEDIKADLRRSGEMDPELVNILSATILMLDPAENAVDDAVRAIQGLAEERAEKVDDD